MNAPADFAMAAAIAAAARIVENGGAFVLDSAGRVTDHDDDEEIRDRTVLTSSSDHASSETDSTNTNDFEEEDAERKLAKNRERNREHARRTRMRKKAHLEILKEKALKLETERKLLQQAIEECNIASILLGISSVESAKLVGDILVNSANINSNSNEVISERVIETTKLVGKRKRFISEDEAEKLPQPLRLTVNGRTTMVGGGKTHMNWKSGIYSDENGIQTKLSPNELECLRRERNRMHAKMTRDRKKSYLATIETTIATLERDNQRMREVLAKLSRTSTHEKYPSKDLCLNDSPSFTIGNFEESQVERTFSESSNTNVQPICG